LFKSDEGKINSYSFVPERGTNLVVAIQKGEDVPIVPLNKDNLTSLIADDPNALSLAQQNMLMPAIMRYSHLSADLYQQREQYLRIRLTLVSS